MMNNIAKCALIAILCGVSSTIFSQNAGINYTGTAPSANAILDLNTGNGKNIGFLIPRVVLGASLNTFSPPMANASTGKDSGMMVFNWLATNQPVGYYCWTGSTWLSVAANNSFVWLLNGNSGTAPSTSLIGSPVNNNFLGTTDAKDFVFATKNLERMRISSSGKIAIGTKNPVSNLDDSGSFGEGVITLSPAASSSTALGNGYTTIVATPPTVSNTYTLTLPSATLYPRRIYTVVYNGKGLGNIDVTSPVAGNIEENGAAVTPLVISQGTVTFQSDGTNWDILNITTANTYGSFLGIKYVTANTAGAIAFDAGTNSIQIKVVGGGGAGGGGSTNGTNGCGTEQDACGSGGGGGGYVEGFMNGITGNTTYSVTIGTGGTGNANCTGSGGSGGNTVLTIANPAATYTANGGTGGTNLVSNGTATYSAGGAGGAASSTAGAGTYLTMSGATGASSVISVGGAYHFDASGTGAGNLFGPGGSALIGRVINEPGVAATCFGAGGGGAISCYGAATASEKGGNGFQGVVIIYEYQ